MSPSGHSYRLPRDQITRAADSSEDSDPGDTAADCSETRAQVATAADSPETRAPVATAADSPETRAPVATAADSPEARATRATATDSPAARVPVATAADSSEASDTGATAADSQRPESQWPQQQTPQRPVIQGPQQQTPQRPESQWPQQQTPQRPVIQGPQQQTPQRPESQWPQQQTPQRPVIQGPQQQTPQRPESQWPQQQTPQRPVIQGPQQQTPQRPESQWPQQQTPQRPVIQGPQQQTPQRPESQWPQQQTPQRPVIQGPQQQTPQRPESQWPQQQTPQRPVIQGPQQQTPQRPESQWPAVTQTPDQRCQVPVRDIVQCGTPDITPSQCQAIYCCFNGQQCYYGKAVTVQCTRDAQFVVVVARDSTWPKIDIDSISLLGGNDRPCSPVGITSAFAIYQFPVTACGTTIKEESGYVVYENRMASSYNVGVGPRGSITRDSHFELLFQCKYSATAVEALVTEVNTVPAPAPVAAPGPLRVELRLAKGTCDTKGCNDESRSFTLYYTEEEYPITKVLRQPLNVEVRILERKDPNLFLMLEHCWTTSDPSPVSMPQWDLIIEDCSYPNDNYLTTMVPVERSSGLLYPNHYKRFTLEMFTFVDHTRSPQKERIFIHCSTSVCYPTPGVSCEPKCNRQRRDVSAAQRKTIQNAVVSSGEVVLVDKRPVSRSDH
ncbi:zona pellucida sperm-binding protein 4-like [Oncorhynchus tshawytscha]|uniref:zona pellucida sperm-binding protein 4-like n=1 Tax=Oncorhynchus tshawytscha TaxID=74940 RepID=UPI001C3C9972|nr:zona pellucida sperm-binding protein 4-like [Oncorhynchus tshawytscha]